MASSNSPPLLLLLLLLFPPIFLNIVLVSAYSHLSLGHDKSSERERREWRGDGGGRREEGGGILGRRVLMSFKEKPSGGNVTYDCSPSGPCVACVYAEKNDDKYRCSETGYRIPLKCVPVGAGSEKKNNKKTQKSRSTLENTHFKEKPHVMVHDAEQLSASIRHRRLLDDSSTLEGGSQPYITYRSCILSVNEEKLSVLGFEGTMLFLLLVSGSVVYFKRKWTSAMSGVGAVRISNNSRF